MSGRTTELAWCGVAVFVCLALAGCADQTTEMDGDARREPKDGGADGSSLLDAARDAETADRTGALLDAAIHNPLCDDTAELQRSHEQALRGAADAGCRLHADCALEADYSACGFGCYFALPDAAIARYRELFASDVQPICAMRDQAGCQRPPIPGCADVVAVCRDQRCEATARE